MTPGSRVLKGGMANSSKRHLVPAALLAVLAATCGGGGSATPTTESTPATCADGADNDGDGATDCEDLYCQSIGACGEDTDGDTGADTDTATGPGAPAKNLRVSRIQLCQTVCTDIMTGFEEVAPLIPIVPNREALLRVHVALLAGWDWRSIWGELRVETASSGEQTLLDQIVLEESSTENHLDSTINFTLPPESVAEGLAYAFALRENGSYVAPGPENPEGLWPAEGLASVPLAELEDPVEIVVVPVRYNADGSGRLPDVTDEALAAIASTFEAMYPIDRVEISVTEPFDWEIPILANGQGWDDLLTSITELHNSEATFEEYYYGLFDPADSLGEFCGGYCVLGLSWVAETADDAWARASIGVGFSGAAAGTMAHEVGHAHGLWHAPCGTTGGDDDPDFPYAGGTIGVTGYNSLSHTLMGSGAYDFMSYCDPDWVSDYHYLALRERIAEVNAEAKGSARGTEAWSSVLLRPDGSIAVGPALRLAAPPSGPVREVVWRDAASRLIGAVEGRFQPFADLPGGLILYPTPPADVAFVELAGHAPLPLSAP